MNKDPDDYFDSEKAFREAVDKDKAEAPGRRAFFGKVGAIVAGAVAADKIGIATEKKSTEPKTEIKDPPVRYEFGSASTTDISYVTGVNTTNFTVDPKFMSAEHFMEHYLPYMSDEDIRELVKKRRNR